MKRGIIILILIGFFIVLVTVILLVILSVQLILSFRKKKPFPKKTLLAILVGVALVALIYINEVYFFTFDRIDNAFIQNGPGPVSSPNGNYTANAYYEPYGGAAGGVNMWVEITRHPNEHNKKIIYYSDANDNVLLDWIDEQTLFITNAGPRNNSIRLNVEQEIYHDSGRACRSWLMKDEYESCYHE